jgi:dipeptidyl aminopeptidase/acylaminoacyl peptidase
MCAGGRTVAEPRLSPDGNRLVHLLSSAGRAALVVVELGADGARGPDLVVSSEPAPGGAHVLGGGVVDWTPDGEHLVYVGGGDLWRQPAAGGPPQRLTTIGRCSSPTVSPDGSRVAFVVDEREVAVVDTGAQTWPVRLTRGADFAFDPEWSPDGERVVWMEWDVPAMPWDSSRIVAAPADGSAPPAPIAGGEGIQVQQPRFSPDGSRLAYLSDEGGWLNVTVLDVATGRTDRLEEPFEHGAPTWGPRQRSFAWSPDGRRLAVTRNEGGFGSLLLWAPGEAPVQVARAVHGSLSWRGDRLAAVRTGGRTPTQIVVHDGAELAVRRTVAVGPLTGFDRRDLPEPELVTWPGDDGVAIPGRLFRPPEHPLGEPPPLLTWVHGGPTDQWQVEFRPRFAYWLSRGWAILVPDHRGSTGHGRAFAQAMAGGWGELDVADVAAGMRAAAERGWGDRRRLVVMGASAGGFTALHVLASHPGLCAAGVDLYGVADLLDLDETTHRFESHYLHSLVGPLPQAASRYRDRSPVNRTASIVDPLLILQGADDPVVSPAQSEAMAQQLRALGRTVELHLYEGEGHGWGRAETVIDELTRTESFLRRHVLRWREP